MGVNIYNKLLSIPTYSDNQVVFEETLLLGWTQIGNTYLFRTLPGDKIDFNIKLKIFDKGKNANGGYRVALVKNEKNESLDSDTTTSTSAVDYNACTQNSFGKYWDTYITFSGVIIQKNLTGNCEEQTNDITNYYLKILAYDENGATYSDTKNPLNVKGICWYTYQQKIGGHIYSIN